MLLECDAGPKSATELSNAFEVWMNKPYGPYTAEEWEVVAPLFVQRTAEQMLANCPIEKRIREAGQDTIPEGIDEAEMDTLCGVRG